MPGQRRRVGRHRSAIHGTAHYLLYKHDNYSTNQPAHTNSTPWRWLSLVYVVSVIFF